MEAIAGKDDKDSTSIGRDDYSFTKALVDDVKGMRIGIPRDYFGEGLDPEVKEAVLNAAKVLESKGAIVEEFDLSLVETQFLLTIQSQQQKQALTLKDSMVLNTDTELRNTKDSTTCTRRHVQRALDQRLREELCSVLSY